MCVPFTYENFKDFNPFNVPTLPQLIKELSIIDKDELIKKKDEMYPNMGPRSAILKPYLNIFTKFIEEYKRK